MESRIISGSDKDKVDHTGQSGVTDIEDASNCPINSIPTVDSIGSGNIGLFTTLRSVGNLTVNIYQNTNTCGAGNSNLKQTK